MAKGRIQAVVLVGIFGFTVLTQEVQKMTANDGESQQNAQRTHPITGS